MDASTNTWAMIAVAVLALVILTVGIVFRDRGPPSKVPRAAVKPLEPERAEPPSLRPATHLPDRLPVDLTKPIVGEDWDAIKRFDGGQEYQAAVEHLFLKYRFAQNPMILSNTIRTALVTSSGAKRSFEEAVIEVAGNDGLGNHH